MTTIVRLQRVPIFSALSDADLAMVATLAKEFEVPKGHVLIEHGQPGSGVFVIQEGTARVTRPHGDDVDLGPGEFFGELSVLAEVPRTGRVAALTDLRGLAIARSDLMDLLAREPAVAVSMLREVSRRLAEAT